MLYTRMCLNKNIPLNYFDLNFNGLQWKIARIPCFHLRQLRLVNIMYHVYCDRWYLQKLTTVHAPIISGKPDADSL